MATAAAGSASGVTESVKQPLVSVHSAATGKAVGNPLRLPVVFRAPIRDDVVRIVHRDMNKNHRQAVGVSVEAGHQTSAQSWGTGRAVARIPRVAGGGTHRSGQGAFGNMCRGGHMFAPNKIWRRWHRKTNLNMKRYALAAAVAASAVTPLVMARGHRVAHIPELPLVVSADSISTIIKTKDAVEMLKKIGAFADVLRVKASKKIRAGKGKARNRRYTQRVGPLIVYGAKGTICRAFRNIPGVDLCCVTRLNLLKLAPGGHLGRFVIWTSDAFEQLNAVFARGNFRIPKAKLSNANIMRIIRSDEVRKATNPAKKNIRVIRKKNPLRNFGAMLKLNPYAATARREIILESRRAHQIRCEIAKAKKTGKPLPKKARKEAKPAAVAAAKPGKKAAKKSPFVTVGKRKAGKMLKRATKKSRKEFQGLLFA